MQVTAGRQGINSRVAIQVSLRRSPLPVARSRHSLNAVSFEDGVRSRPGVLLLVGGEMEAQIAMLHGHDCMA